MFDFYQEGFPFVVAMFAGAAVLGVALFYGVTRAGWLRPSERAKLDANTRQRQRTEDPQKR